MTIHDEPQADGRYETIIHNEEPPTKPPPLLEVGPLAWLRQNLFSSPADIVLTIASVVLIIAMVISFFSWAIQEANWYAIINNLRVFMLDRFEFEFEWRVALTVLIAGGLVGVSIATWGRRSARTVALVGGGFLLAMAIIPTLIESTIPFPSSYFTVGNIDIVDRQDTLSAQTELGFIAAEGETIRISVASDEVADDPTLAELSGFSDREANALLSNAQRGIERRERVAEIAQLLLSGTQTDDQLERLDAEIRTLRRTGDVSEEAEVRLEEVVAMLKAGEDVYTVDGEDVSYADEFLSILDVPTTTSTYPLVGNTVNIELLDGASQAVLSSDTLSVDSDALEFSIPADGWYIIRKTIAEGEEGLAIIKVDGINPMLERTAVGQETVYYRLTDDFLEVEGGRPEIEGDDVPFAQLTDNQFRGKRSFGDYLAHFVPVHLRQMERLFLPTFLVGIFGFVLGRALAHAMGTETRFNNGGARLTLLGVALLPLVPVLIYFGPVNGDFGMAEMMGLPAAILKVLIIVGAIVLAGQLNAWMNRTNHGEEAEGDLGQLSLYAWGLFPVAMYVLASGIGNFAGATVGSGIAGLVWLAVMYFAGLNFRGLMGYGLLLGALFLPFAQRYIVESIWPAYELSDLQPLLNWVILAVLGFGAGYFGYLNRDSISQRMAGYGVQVSALVWIIVVFLMPLLATNDAEIVQQIRDLPILNLLINPDWVSNVELVSYGVLGYVVWLVFMFFVGTTVWNPTWLVTGIFLMSVQWFNREIGIDFWSSIFFLAWLVVGMVFFNRGQEQGELRKRKEVNEQTRAERLALPGLIGSALVWLGVLILVPTFVTALDSAGILQTSPNDLLPLTDKRRWGGLMLTMQLTILGIGLSFPIGLALALGRRSSLPIVKSFCIGYIELIRGVPLVTVLFMAQLLVPLVDPSLAEIEGFIRVLVGVTMFSAAYLAENVRGGLQSVPGGQTEASQALGLAGWQTTLFITLPQALRAVIPALVGQFISLFKDTSLVFIVGLTDLTRAATKVVAQAEFIGFRRETFLYVAIIYFIFSYLMSYISRRIEETGSGAAMARRL